MKISPVISIVLAIVLTELFFLPSVAAAASPIVRFDFVTDAQVVRSGEISLPMTVQAQDAGGNAQISDETIDLVFSSASASGEFVNGSGDSAKTVMSKGTANRTFYYRDKTAGTHTLSVRAVGRVTGQSWTARQDIVVSATGQSPPLSAAASTTASSSSVATSSYHASVAALPPVPTMTASAGEDHIVLAGVEEPFTGEAIGLVHEPIANARFWWNFGDGATAEGRSVGHIYQEPGVYTASLSVSSGEYAASDYALVRVLPNKISVAGVVPGEAGWVRIANPAIASADIGGWRIEDDRGRTFYLPVRTVIASEGEVSFANRITGLAPDKKIFLRYAGGLLASAGETGAPVAQETTTAHTATTSSPRTVLSGDLLVLAGADAASTVSDSAVSSATDTPASDTARSVASAAAAASGTGFPRLFFIGAFGLSALAAAGFFLARRVIT